MRASRKDALEAEILQRLQTDPFRADRHRVLLIHAVEIYPDDRRFRKEGLPAWVSLRCPALTAPERLSGEAGFGTSSLGDAKVPERPESGPYRPLSAICAGPPERMSRHTSCTTNRAKKCGYHASAKCDSNRENAERANSRDNHRHESERAYS